MEYRHEFICGFLSAVLISCLFPMFFLGTILSFFLALLWRPRHLWVSNGMFLGVALGVLGGLLLCYGALQSIHPR